MSLLAFFQGTTALVTGASSGLGAEFARQLAPSVARLVVTGRREDRLARLRTELKTACPHLEVRAFSCDLAQNLHREILLSKLRERNLLPDLLINNAGLGDYGAFEDASWPKTDHMIQVNMTALTRLTQAVLPDMITRGGGGVVNVSSLASLLPIPDFAVYAASKAYVTSFSEALRIETAAHRIRVLAVCPGPVKTEFGAVARRHIWDDNSLPIQNFLEISPARVVSESLRALAENRPRVYPGALVNAAAGILSALPPGILRILLRQRPRKVRQLPEENNSPTTTN